MKTAPKKQLTEWTNKKKKFNNNDEKYAQKLLEHLINNKNMSKSFIRQEMYKRGVPTEISSSLLEDAEIDNVESIKELIIKKYKTKLSAEGGTDKVIAALMRKGFSFSDIKTALEEFEDEEI